MSHKEAPKSQMKEKSSVTMSQLVLQICSS